MRFVVLVRSFWPLEAYLYDVFWLRISAIPYSLEDFDVFEKHWTVMNYSKPGLLTQVHYDAFIPEFNKAHGEKRWEKDCYPKIRRMIFDSLTAASFQHRDTLICHEGTHHCRAAYGYDVMLDDQYEPKLLEVTFSPDCTRAVKYHPHFFNDVFMTLFEGLPTHCQLLRNESKDDTL